jgi:hypothetical protein
MGTFERHAQTAHSAEERKQIRHIIYAIDHLGPIQKFFDSQEGPTKRRQLA